MKLLYQFGIIMFVTFLGEFLHCLIPLPIPASIYGLLLMLAGLMTKVIKLEQVKIATDFLIEIMPPMFIPAAVGLIVTWSDLKVILVPVLVITCITTVFVMVVTGRTAQAVMHLKEKHGKDRRWRSRINRVISGGGGEEEILCNSAYFGVS